LLEQVNQLRCRTDGAIAPTPFSRADFSVLPRQRFGVPERSLFPDRQRICLGVDGDENVQQSPNLWLNPVAEAIQFSCDRNEGEVACSKPACQRKHLLYR
jgi:hypothetical protein